MARVRLLGLVLAGLMGLALAGMYGCSSAPPAWSADEKFPRVVVTIAPLYSFVRGVAGERGAVRCLCTTTGPHHYLADSHDFRLLQEADLFLAVGLTLDDHFADPMQTQVTSAKLRYVKLGDKLPESLLRKLAMPIKHGDHVHTGYDPHVWLGTEQAVKLVEAVRDELGKVDPDGKETYRKNADDYVEKLRKLQEEGKKELAGKKTRRLLTQHDSLHYFARSFGLEIAGVIQTMAGDEPTPGQIAELIDLCEKAQEEGKPIGAIAIEPQYPKHTAAERLQQDLKGRKKGINIPLVKVDPLETADEKELKEQGGAWYEKRMRENVKALVDVLP